MRRDRTSHYRLRRDCPIYGGLPQFFRCALERENVGGWRTSRCRHGMAWQAFPDTWSDCDDHGHSGRREPVDDRGSGCQWLAAVVIMEMAVAGKHVQCFDCGGGMITVS